MAKRTVKQTKTDYPFGKLNNLLSKLSSLKNFRSSKKFYIALVVLGLLVLAVYKKGWFVAALVNGSPITNFELQMRLNKQFRSQTLNQMINEKIIMSEPTKNNALPSDAEINQKISEIETSVGGAKALDDILSSQGQDRSTIRDQLRLQLSIEKLYQQEATVSAEEIDKFLQTNSAQLRASDS